MHHLLGSIWFYILIIVIIAAYTRYESLLPLCRLIYVFPPEEEEEEHGGKHCIIIIFILQGQNQADLESRRWAVTSGSTSHTPTP